MPKPRNRENTGLPARWRFRYNAYYYHPPKILKEHWDNKSEFRLGKTLSEAHRVFAERIALGEKAIGLRPTTLNDLIDRYLREVTPTKSQRTQKDEASTFAGIRALIGHNTPDSIKTKHCYQVYEELKKRGLTTANRHIEKLSHLYTKAIEWGIVDEHPMVGKFRKQHAMPARTYITDETIAHSAEREH